ncbi:MAG: hypothetical protein JSU70_03980, partial [Phycisphaerales bacterium]
KVSDLNADVLEGHLSSALCHMGNISHRLGKSAPADEIAEAIKANKEMKESFDRFEQHLRANQVDFAQTPRILGPCLTFDPERERFVGEFSEQANRLLTRNYREPFVVPEQV